MNAACALQHFCDNHGAQTLLCTEAKPFIDDSDDGQSGNLSAIYSEYIRSENPTPNSRCKSCTISSENLIISTMDTTNHLLFITAQSTPNQELFKDIRNACVRSLNIEKAMEVDYPILFGDDEDGYCLSLIFPCKDFQARGSQRLYSICYLSRDKYALLSLMSLITECMRQTAYWLQADANETYDDEGRIKINTNLNGLSNSATYIVRPPPQTPSQRMLSDIVHDSKLIFRIHALFVWLLRSANSAIIESLFDALPTEDQTTNQERRVYTHVLFVQDIGSSFSESRAFHSRTSTMVAQSLSNTVRTTSMIAETLVKPTHQQSILASSIYSSADVNFTSNGFDEDDDFDSLQYQYSSYAGIVFSIFRLFVQKLNNNKHLQYILYHWAIGNRLIIKYSNFLESKDWIRALTSVFRLILPDGCFELYEAKNQAKSCTANLVLIDTDIPIKSENLENVYDVSNKTNLVVVRIILDDIDQGIRVVKLETVPATKQENPIPLYVKSLMEIINDQTLDEDSFESIVTQQKLKYLNKAKLYFQIGRCQSTSKPPPDDRQQISLLNVENTGDLSLIRFWQKGLSQAYRKQIRLLKQDDNQHHSRTERRS